VAIGKKYVEGITNTLVKLEKLSMSEADAIKKAFHDSEHDVFDDFLIQEGLVERDELLKALSVYYQLPSFDVVGYFFETLLLQKFPKDFLLRNAIIPIEVDENMLLVVASEPDLPDLLPQIGDFVSYDILFYVGLEHDICDAVEEYYEQALTQESQDEDLRQERLLAREEHDLELQNIEVDATFNDED